MSTRLIRSLHNLKPRHQGAIVTMGNFDGVHLGHQQLLATAIALAKQHAVPSLVVTFEPHPFEFFKQANLTIPRLTRLREKFCAMAKMGVDNVLILPFNHKVASLSASDFIKQYLWAALKPVYMVIGDDFHFGRERQGDYALLKTMGVQLGFGVDAISTVKVRGERVSSTRVRQALKAGDHLLAKALLGHPYTMMGRIRQGDQRGRKWGFPTANIDLHRSLTPVKGVYHVYVHGIASKPLPGVANVGVRPTVDGTRTLLEVHLHDFNQEIYGRYVSIEFCEKWRDEVQFSNVVLLKQQIAADVLASRQYFHLDGAK